MKTTLPILVLSFLLVPAAAGPKLDALEAEVTARIALLAGEPTWNPKVEDLKAAGLALMNEALGLFDSGGDDTSAAFAVLGKGLATLEKAAARAGPGDFAVAVQSAAQQIWIDAIGVFTPGVGKVSPDEALAKKLVVATKAAAKERFGKAVGKLAKAWPWQVVIDPNP